MLMLGVESHVIGLGLVTLVLFSPTVPSTMDLSSDTYMSPCRMKFGYAPACLSVRQVNRWWCNHTQQVCLN